MGESRRHNSSRRAFGTLARMPASARAAMHRGWIDAQNRPKHWPRYYDLMPEAEQLLYEFGRLALRNVMAAGLAVPNWRGELEDAEAFHLAGMLATSLTGTPWPERAPHA